LDEINNKITTPRGEGGPQVMAMVMMAGRQMRDYYYFD
jgi:hypothetical protein